MHPRAHNAAMGPAEPDSARPGRWPSEAVASAPAGRARTAPARGRLEGAGLPFTGSEHSAGVSTGEPGNGGVASQLRRSRRLQWMHIDCSFGSRACVAAASGEPPTCVSLANNAVHTVRWDG